MKDFIFTSESITEGHPDKVCDKIADSILDVALSQDSESKMAVEATIKLIEQLGGEVVGCAFLIELVDLKGREALEGYDVLSLMEY